MARCVGNYVYLLIVRESLRLREQVVKVGRSDNYHDRMSQYPKGSIVISAVRVSNSEAAENAALGIFKHVHIHRRDLGKEYFEVRGNFESAAKDFLCAVAPYCCMPFDSQTTASEDDVGDGDTATTSVDIVDASTSNSVVAHDIPQDVEQAVYMFVKDNKSSLVGATIPVDALHQRFTQWTQGKLPQMTWRRFTSVLRSFGAKEVRSGGMNCPDIVFPACEPVDDTQTHALIGDSVADIAESVDNDGAAPGVSEDSDSGRAESEESEESEEVVPTSNAGRRGRPKGARLACEGCGQVCSNRQAKYKHKKRCHVLLGIQDDSEDVVNISRLRTRTALRDEVLRLQQRIFEQKRMLHATSSNPR